MGTVSISGFIFCNPSIADATEIGGVIIPSAIKNAPMLLLLRPISVASAIEKGLRRDERDIDGTHCDPYYPFSLFSSSTPIR